MTLKPEWFPIAISGGCPTGHYRPHKRLYNMGVAESSTCKVCSEEN